jgi:hypothetical protein
MHSPGANVGRWASVLMNLRILGMDPKRKYAQFGLRLACAYPENPVKPSVSGHVKNMPKSRPVCQNTAELHLSKSPPKGLKLRLFLPLILPHPDPGKAAGMRI